MRWPAPSRRRGPAWRGTPGGDPPLAGRGRGGGDGPGPPRPPQLAQESPQRHRRARAGAGKKGPIARSDGRLPAAPVQMTATVEYRAIVVKWTNPRHRVDNTRLRGLAEVRLFRREGAPGREPKPGT